MDLIYKNARAVIIALDDIAADHDEVAFLRRYFESYSYSNLAADQHPNRGLSPPFMHTQVPLRKFFERVLSSVWFERAWCGQEMRMARNHVFLVPCMSNEDEDTYSFIRFTGSFF